MPTQKRKWIKSAVSPAKKGTLRRKLGIKKGQDIPMSKLKKAAKSRNLKLRREAILAETLRKVSRRRKKTS